MEPEVKFSLVGTVCDVFNFADSAGSIWFYTGSMEILTFKKDHCNQCCKFYTFIKIKSNIWTSFKS